MFILRFIRYLQGYVQFKAQGVFVERFLNLVARDRIPVWDGNKRGDVYTGYVSAGSYAKMRAHAKKSGVRLRISGKQGVPFHRRRYRKRTGLLVGAGLFAAFLLIMSAFIWRIEIHGSEKVSEASIAAVLGELGIKPGTLRGTINVRDAERRLVLAFQEFSWVALNIDGSVIRLQVTERDMPPPMLDPGTPCNIVADRAGQILQLRVYEGQPMVRKGDAVMAGDVIVSGITEDRLGQNLFRHALADVVAEVQQTISLEVPLAQVEYEPTGDNMKRTYLRIFSLELPVFWPRQIPVPYKAQRETTQAQLFSFDLPIHRLTETYILMREVPVTLTEEQAKVRAMLELAAVEQVEFDGGNIIDRVIEAKLDGNVYRLKADYVVHMDIGAKAEIVVEG